MSGKITEKQLDHQRRFITERLETFRANLDDHRARESEQAEKRALAEHVVEWVRRAGDRLDGLSDEGRREVLQLLLDGATIDRHNNVNLTLAVPTEDVVSIAGQEPRLLARIADLLFVRPGLALSFRGNLRKMKRLIEGPTVRRLRPRKTRTLAGKGTIRSSPDRRDGQDPDPRRDKGPSIWPRKVPRLSSPNPRRDKEPCATLAAIVPGARPDGVAAELRKKRPAGPTRRSRKASRCSDRRSCPFPPPARPPCSAG